MSRHVALLRGVNVGGAHRLPMAALRQIVERVGGANVATFIQSGNVVFDADDREASVIADKTSALVQSEFGFRAPIVFRRADRWRRLVADNPFADAGVKLEDLHLCCLSAEPDPPALARLDPARSPPDEFRVVGADIYLRLPNGVAKSKLTNAWFDAKLGGVSTSRNWRTVLALRELLEERAK